MSYSWRKIVRIALVMLVAAPVFAQVNLLPNPGFETGMTNWAHTQSGTATVVTNSSLAHSGSNYAELSLPGSTTGSADHIASADNSGTTVFYAVSPGDVLTFGGWATLVAGNGRVQYTLALYDSTKASKGFVSTPVISAATWTQASVNYVVPAGIAFVKFYGELANPTIDSTARFDDAVLSDSPLQSISVTPNPASVLAGSTVQFAATGNYAGGGTQTLTTMATWASSVTSVATVSNTAGSQGLATGVSPGTANISATLGTVGGSSTLTVSTASNPTLTSITITPGYPNITGGSQQFTATGNYSDNSTQNLTTSVTWGSSNTAIASISNTSGSQGLATSTGQVGATEITATSGSIIGATILQVSSNGNVLANPGLESGSGNWIHGQGGAGAVLSNPANANTGSGYIELNLNGSTSVTQDAMFSANGSNATTYYPVNPGDTLTYGGWINAVVGNGRLTYTLAVYDSNKANPSYVSTSSSAVTGNTWTQVTSTYTVPTGKAFVTFYAHVYNPSTNTTARFDDAYLFDTPATLLSIAVTPNPKSMVAGTQQQYSATGTYTGGITEDLTASVAWSSDNAAVATVSNTSGTQGLVNAVTGGSANIIATSGSVSGSASLTVTSSVTLIGFAITPSYPNIASGTQQFTATGSYNDGSTQNLTNSVTWTSSNTSVATISNTSGSQGRASSAGTVGATKITAAGTMTSATILTVSGSGNTLPNSSFESGATNWAKSTAGTGGVTTNSVNANTGNNYAQLSLPGSPTSSQATYASATSSGGAALYPISQGQILTFGGWANLVTGNAKVTFNLALYDSNKSNPVYVGTPAATTNNWTQLNATYTVPAGRSYVKFYMQVYNPTTATTAWFDDAYLLITPPVLQAITVTPNPASLLINKTQQFAATGTFTGGLTQDVTTSATWSSSNTSVATVSNAGGSQGIATGVTAGTANITATSGSISGSAALTVTSSATIVGITVTPANPVITGGTQQFTATASYNDGSTGNVTNSVIWSTAYPAVATISNASGSHGLATSTGQVGTTPVTATSGSISGSTVLSVSHSGSLASIRHIIILVQENRSFDNYFGQLGAYRQLLGYTDPFNGTPNVTLQDKAGASIAPFHFRTVCHENLTPDWDDSHQYWDNGAMDKFMLGNGLVSSTIDPQDTRAMGYYDWNDLPYYYQAATQFATSDTYFSSVLAPTIPNRLYIMTGTSFGHIRTDSPPAGGWTQPTIFDALTSAGISWRYYYQDTSHNFLADFATYQQHPSVSISNYFTDIQNEATLPSVLFIDRKGGQDEHPNTNIQPGAANVKQIIDALMASPSWPSSVFILTFDEGGGLYDHVSPPAAVPPDSIPPMLQTGDYVASFNQFGFRVPLIVFSPWIKPHFVSHVNRDHTSWLKLVETRFGVPPLTARDSAADDMTEFFDFSTPNWLTPPQLPAQPTGGTCSYSLEIAP